MDTPRKVPFRVGDVVKNPVFSDREFVVMGVRYLKWKHQWTMELGVTGETGVVLGNQYVTSHWEKVRSDA